MLWTLRYRSAVYYYYYYLKVLVMAGNLRRSGCEFQRAIPRYAHSASLKRSILGIGCPILSFPECRDWFKESLAVKKGGAFPDIILCILDPLLQ